MILILVIGYTLKDLRDYACLNFLCQKSETMYEIFLRSSCYYQLSFFKKSDTTAFGSVDKRFHFPYQKCISQIDMQRKGK